VEGLVDDSPHCIYLQFTLKLVVFETPRNYPGIAAVRCHRETAGRY
jgi:hypothetical protein